MKIVPLAFIIILLSFFCNAQHKISISLSGGANFPTGEFRKPNGRFFTGTGKNGFVIDLGVQRPINSFVSLTGTLRYIQNNFNKESIDAPTNEMSTESWQLMSILVGARLNKSIGKWTIAMTVQPGCSYTATNSFILSAQWRPGQDYVVWIDHKPAAKIAFLSGVGCRYAINDKISVGIGVDYFITKPTLHYSFRQRFPGQSTTGGSDKTHSLEMYSFSTHVGLSYSF